MKNVPNKVSISDATVTIEVTNRKNEKFFVLVDVEDWVGLPSPTPSLYIRDGYAAYKRSGKCVWLHQVVLGVRAEYLIDHINRNKLDNTRGNLRHCRMKDSNINRGMPSHNKSGVMGVHWHKALDKWCGGIKFDGKQHRAYFANFDDAVAHRKVLEGQYWGQYVGGSR